MRTEKIAWTVSVILVAVLAFQLPGTLAQRDDDYAFVRTLVDIHRQIAVNYADDVNSEFEDKLREGAINGMLGQLDPFTMYVPPDRQEEFERILEGNFEGVGIQLNQNETTGEVQVISPIDGSPALEAGVLAGDVILKVNGEDITGLRLPDIVKKIAGPTQSEVTLTVRHLTGEEVDLSMKRRQIVVPTVKGFERKGDNSWDYYVHRDPKIGYIRITQFNPDTFPKLKEALDWLLADGMKGLILDLRFNPGGRLDQAREVVDLFLDEGVIVMTKGRNRPQEISRAQREGTLPEFPMVVLVNEHSASAAEIVAGSLMDNGRALVLGRRTYGKGSVQEVIPLDGKSGELKLTVAYYYLPSGRLVHRKKDATDWGVEPQINVALDETAQRWILQDRYDKDVVKNPNSQPSTRPATQPTTMQTDSQLEAALSTLIGHIVLKGHHDFTASTLPATQPVAQ